MSMFSYEIVENILLGLGIIILIIQIYIDCRYRLLLDELNLGLLILGGGYAYLRNTLGEGLLGVLGGLLGLIYVVSKDGLGLGDVKLGMALGIWLGPAGGWFCLLVALVLGSLMGIGGWLLGIMNRKSTLPFGPFLIIGAMIVFGGEQGLYQWLFWVEEVNKW